VEHGRKLILQILNIINTCCGFLRLAFYIFTSAIIPGFARVRPPTHPPHHTTPKPNKPNQNETTKKKSPKKLETKFQNCFAKKVFKKMGPSPRCADLIPELFVFPQSNT
jgi:hypothetical protein